MFRVRARSGICNRIDSHEKLPKLLTISYFQIYQITMELCTQVIKNWELEIRGFDCYFGKGKNNIEQTGSWGMGMYFMKQPAK